MLSKGLQHGELVIEEGDDQRVVGAPEEGRETVRLIVLNSNFWVRIFVSHDMGCECITF